MTRTIEYTHTFKPTKHSAVVSEVFYDQNHRELFVKLHNGAICGYGPISSYLYEEFRSAESAGNFWNTKIRNIYGTLNGDVNFVPYHRGESATANPASDGGNRAFSVVVNVNGDLKFDLDATDVVAATKKVYELIEKSVVDGTYFVKEVKVNQ